mgnify:FL=1
MWKNTEYKDPDFKGKYVGIEAPSLSSIIDWLQSSERVTTRSDPASASEYRAGWDCEEVAGFGSDGEAVMAEYWKMALDGFPRATEKLQAMMVGAGDSHLYKDDWTFDVAGSVPNIPLYISGEPANMQYLEPKADKPLCKILIEGGCSGGTKEAAIFNRGVALLSGIQALESQGVAVELQYMSSCQSGYIQNYIVTFPIIEMGQGLDLDRVAFCLANPGMLRRVIFACQERSPKLLDQTDGGGYGEGSSRGFILPGFDIHIPRINTRHSGDCSSLDAAHEYINGLFSEGGFGNE